LVLQHGGERLACGIVGEHEAGIGVRRCDQASRSDVPACRCEHGICMFSAGWNTLQALVGEQPVDG
jgi:hypothetical protein